MAKFLKVAGVLFVIMIVSYMGAHFWLRWKRTVRDDVTKMAALVDCVPNDVRAITMERGASGQEKFRFERVDQPPPGTPPAMAFAQSDWRYRAPLAGEADGALLKRLAATVCELWDPVPIREAEVGSTDLALTYELEDGSAIRAGLGAPGPDRLVPMRLTNRSGAVKAARIPDLLLQVASRPALEYRSRLVTRMEADNVQLATLTIDGKEKFTLERAGADWVVLAGGKKLGPGAGDAGKFVNRMATLQAIDILEPEYGPAACRMLKAKAKLSLRGVAGREETVIFDYGRGGDVAACSTARSMKFRVHRDLVKYLDVSPKSLVAN